MAKRISACAAPRTCVTVPGADSTASVHMVWIESMTTRRGVVPCASVAMMSSTVVSAASSTGASARPSRSARSRTCADRLLAGDVDDALAGAGERRGGLDQQRRLADAGIAAEQEHRAAHEAAAGDAVEFGDAGRHARRVLGLAGEPLEREQPALARRPAGAGGQRALRRPPSSTIVFQPPQASHLPCQRP